MTMTPPLSNVRIIEFEGLGPAPLAARMLADMGATVTAITRPGRSAVSAQLGGSDADPFHRGKEVVILDLKQPEAVARALDLVAAADVLIEGNRPGVMERLGLGPTACASRNPRLVYARMTGWGQTGPLSAAAGHDLNYVALTGVLSLSAHRGERPIIPPAVVGDAGGALGMAFGIVCAVLEARSSGRGRVVDAAIVDVMAMMAGIALFARAGGQLGGSEPSPFHDSPFYDVYECADGKFVTLGALEPQFYRLLLEKLGLTDVSPARQYDKAGWPALKARVAALFRSREQAHWCALLEGTDVCFAPVLTLDEARRHRHIASRNLYQATPGGAFDSVAAPRFLPLVDGA